jgi:hypothetical protein
MANSRQIFAANLNTTTNSCFSVAPLGSPLPVNATNALDATFTDCGWMGNDGFVINPKRTIKRHMAFGGQTVKTTQTDYQESITATFYESSPIVFQTLWGVLNATTAPTGAPSHRTQTIIHNCAMLPRATFVITTIDAGGSGSGLQTTRRLVAQEGEILELKQMTYATTELVKYTVTIDCYQPINGTQAVLEYIDEPQIAYGS